jgi:hypothetical protein
MKRFALKNIVRTFLLSCLLTCGSLASARAVEFFSVLPEVPLPPRAAQLNEETIIFDKPGGRYIEVMAAVPDNTPPEVLSYYNRVLPQLGWTSLAGERFARDGEVLRVTSWRADGRTLLRLRLLPETELFYRGLSE